VGKPNLTRRQRRWYEEVISCLKEKPKCQFSYHYWSFYPYSNIGSSWAWGAYCCAKKYGSRAGVDLKKLQLITLKYGDAEQLYRFARDIPSANVKRFQKALVEAGDYRLMKAFSDNIPGANQEYLKNLLIIMEVMDF